MEATVSLISYTPQPDALCSVASKNCVSKEVPGFDMYANSLNTALESGHYSILEHATFTFSIENMTRVTLAQFTRHRMASYAVKSQRYTSAKGVDYILPGRIIELLNSNDESFNKFDQYHTSLKVFLDNLIDNKIPNEDIRYLFPEGTTTNMIVTMNGRELLHFFELRCCNKAQWEIRNIAKMMLKLVKEVAPIMFAKAGPPCVSGKCREKNPCGKA